MCKLTPTDNPRSQICLEGRASRMQLRLPYLLASKDEENEIEKEEGEEDAYIYQYRETAFLALFRMHRASFWRYWLKQVVKTIWAWYSVGIVSAFLMGHPIYFSRKKHYGFNTNFTFKFYEV